MQIIKPRPSFYLKNQIFVYGLVLLALALLVIFIGPDGGASLALQRANLDDIGLAARGLLIASGTTIFLIIIKAVTRSRDISLKEQFVKMIYFSAATPFFVSAQQLAQGIKDALPLDAEVISNLALVSPAFALTCGSMVMTAATMFAFGMIRSPFIRMDDDIRPIHHDSNTLT